MDQAVIDRLLTHLSDAHALEEQALAQLRTAPGIAGEPELAAQLEAHLAETEGHERMVRERIEQLGGAPSRARDVLAAAGGKGFILFARSQPDTPGKLAAHAFSYEHLELAAYELLASVADHVGDRETSGLARRIAAEERRMGQRIAECLPAAARASIGPRSPQEVERALTAYLADAHAIESQATALLERAPGMTDDEVLRRSYAEHLEETHGHVRMLEERLSAHDASPSAIKDAAMRLGALSWSAFFRLQGDTPAKLAAFAYAFEHLEIAGYEELALVASRAGDTATVAACHRILTQERAAAERIAEQFDRVAGASLEAAGAHR